MPKMKEINKQDEVIRFVKYCVVGVMNTLLTLGVIYVCNSLLHINDYVSNALGYVCGVINSFICNKQWVFNSSGRVSGEVIRFLCGFLLCYALQFLVVWLINQSWFGDVEVDLRVMVLSGYGIATLVGNVVYTLANFVYHRVVTFKGTEK